MTSVSDRLMIDAVRQYWAPANGYYFQEAASNWNTLVRNGNFAAWSRPLRTDTERYLGQREVTNAPGQSSTKQHRARSLTVTTPEHGEVQVQLFPPVDHDGTPYLGHSPGDHVFRLAHDPANNQFENCLKYEGQIPRSREQYWHRLETHILPDVIDMAISLLVFVPQPRGQGHVNLVPECLQEIRNKGGKPSQADIDLLLEFWELKFTDYGEEGNTVKICPREVVPQSMAGSSMRTYTEAAFLINKLQFSSGPETSSTPRVDNPTFELHSVIRLLEKMTDKPMARLLKLHHKNMKNEGLRILSGVAGRQDQVLVYCRDEDVSRADVQFQSKMQDDERRRLNKDAAEFRWGGARNPANAAPKRNPAATESASQSLRRLGLVFKDPLKSSTFHQFYQHRDFVHRAASEPDTTANAHDPITVLPTSPDRPASDSAVAHRKSDDKDIRDCIEVASPPAPQRSSPADRHHSRTVSHNHSHRPQIGDKGVAVPKGRVEKRRKTTPPRPKTPSNDVRRFFLP